MASISLNSKPDLDALRLAMTEALQAVEKKYDVRFRAGNISYEGDGSSCVVKVNVTAAPGGKPVDLEKKKFLQWAELVGLKKTDYHRQFTFRHEAYRIVGMKPGRSEKIVAEHVVGGKRFLFDAEDVAKLLSREAEVAS